MKLGPFGEHGEYTLHFPATGGKAGRGRNKTSALQVRRHNCIVKQFRFTVAQASSRDAAYAKACRFMSATP